MNRSTVASRLGSEYQSAATYLRRGSKLATTTSEQTQRVAGQSAVKPRSIEVEQHTGSDATQQDKQQGHSQTDSTTTTQR